MPFDNVPSEDSRVELLRGVRRELVQRGWCQHEYLNVAGQVCAVGAAVAVFGAFDEKGNLRNGCCDIDRAETELARAWGNKTGSDIIIWNDVPGRKLDDLLKHIDERIVELQAETSARVR